MTNHKQLAEQDLLDAVPIRNRAVGIRRSGDRVTLSMPLQQRWYMKPPFNWVLPFRGRRRIELDILGNEIWEACDGDRSCEQIIDGFAEAHHLTFQEARAAVVRFIQSLVQRRLIVLAVGRNSTLSDISQKISEDDAEKKAVSNAGQRSASSLTQTFDLQRSGMKPASGERP